MYDIVFVSYQEPNAESNWKALSDRFPSRTKRLHGVKGIHQAISATAYMVDTDMYYIVDGDAVVLPDFHFNYVVAEHEKTNVHAFRARNPVNNLIYGYGAVKIFPTEIVQQVGKLTNKTDMSTGLINAGYSIVDIESNITQFNTDPIRTWCGAFRECVKLASKTIDRQLDEMTKYRLDVWCTTGVDQAYGNWCIKGALAGRTYGEKFANDKDAIFKINDFNWLQQQFAAISSLG